jgi:hypothetical protein
LRIKSDVAGIVEKEIELRFMGTRSGQIEIIQRTAIRRYK